MSKINLEYIFPTALYTTQLVGMDKINKDLINYIYILLKEDKNIYQKSSSGGITIRLDTSNKYVNALCQELFPLCKGIAKSIKWDLKNYELNCVDIWTVINKRKSFNNLHSHKNSILSCVYYLKIPKDRKGGNFVIQDPRNACEFFPQPTFLEDCSHNLKTTVCSINHNPNEMQIEPEVGKMIVFPSWLEHRVIQNLSDEEDSDRICIAFNIIEIDKCQK